MYGSGTGLATTDNALRYHATDPTVGDLFGMTLFAADFNGDGDSDLAVGAPIDATTAVAWLGLTAVTAAPLAVSVGLNGAACAYDTLGDAIAAATDGDTIYLAPNTYNETLGSLNMDLHFTAATPDCTTAVPDTNLDSGDYIIDGGGAVLWPPGRSFGHIVRNGYDCG